MGFPGGFELILIFLAVLLIFGAKRIPEIARGVGKGIREFKDATSDIQRELESEGQREQRPRARSPRQGAPQPRQQQPSRSGEAAGSAQREPAHQEAGRPSDPQDAPPQPGSAANPGEEKADG